MDPLRLIRDYTTKGVIERSTHDETHIHLDGQYSLPRKSTTNYKAKMGKGFLTVEAIWFLAKSHVTNPKAAHAAYMKEALSAKFAQVSLIDRKDLLDYLTGKVETSTNVDVSVPAFTVPDDVYAAGGWASTHHSHHTTFYS